MPPFECKDNRRTCGMEKVLVKNGKVVNPEGKSGLLDILIEDGKIKSIGETIVTPNLKGTDANATAVKVQEIAVPAQLTYR